MNKNSIKGDSEVTSAKELCPFKKFVHNYSLPWLSDSTFIYNALINLPVNFEYLARAKESARKNKAM